MSEPLKIYRPDGGEVESPDPELVQAAQRALWEQRRSGRRLIEFWVPEQLDPWDGVLKEPVAPAEMPIYRVANPYYRTYP